jgi:hypothetical protein
VEAKQSYAVIYGTIKGTEALKKRSSIMANREMEDVCELVPTGKADIARAQAAVRIGCPAVAPVLYELVEWLQDYNWPVAHILVPFLRSLGAPLVPHIWRVLQSNDDVWKYWVMDLLISSLSKDVASEFRRELERLCFSPEPNEKQEELDEQARQLLEHFSWLSNA